MPVSSKVILISILSLGREQNVLNQLAELPAWLAQFTDETGILSHIVIRNNDPQADFSATAARMRALEAEFPTVACTLVTGKPNNGFGAGHNTNVALAPSDYVLILNDDIGFPHISWLGEAIRLLSLDPRTVCVGADENPKHINYAFGNGLLPGAFHLHTLPYAEASVLLFERAAFDRLGGFGADFRWAMCEDSDLSLKVQQHGWRIAHISMPHQHWRSTSFNALPGPVKSSILEHNRAALFANWRDSFTAGKVGRFEVFDLWSDGLGDVFCALPHLLARIAPLSTERRANIIINTSQPELISWLGLDGIRVSSIRDLAQLRAELECDGIATVRSIRDINYSLPFNIHPLLAGALGVDQASSDTHADFAALLCNRRQPGGGIRFKAKTYCVVHLEFDRDHEGRGLETSVAANLAKLCAQSFDRIVLVGRQRLLSVALFGRTDADILDLQGKLSLSQLASIIAHAAFFVGIDSFPAHVAQSCQVPSAVCFGAIHPLARVWDDSLVWPLTAPLDCIGCYHSHVEASVPFCMRRDMACTRLLEPASMQPVIADMQAGKPFCWTAERLRWHSLQARLIKLTRYHPAPPERLFRPQLAPNEQISNSIYRMTEQIGSLLGGHYHTSTVTALAAQTSELQAELFATRVELEEAKRHQSVLTVSPETVSPQPAMRIVQLHSLDLVPVRCRFNITGQWIDTESTDDDPQISLPVLQGGGGKVQLRLSSVAEAGDALQIYWALDDANFSAEQVHTVACSGGIQTVNLVFDLAEAEQLHIRIDPTTGSGKARLRGSLGGHFILLDAKQNMSVETPALVTEARAPRGGTPRGGTRQSAAGGDTSQAIADARSTRRTRQRAAETEHA